MAAFKSRAVRVDEEALRALPAKSVVIDGEIVASDKQAYPSSARCTHGE
jgi:ATP-dependent DNA ligase